MKFLTLVIALFIATPVIAADCTPVGDKKVDEKSIPAKKKHKKYEGTVIPSEIKKDDKKVEEKVAEKPTKKKHKKYEGTKIPDAKK